LLRYQKNINKGQSNLAKGDITRMQ